MHRPVAVALALCAFLALAAPASAKQHKLVAAGEGGPTVCTLEYKNSLRMFTRFVSASGTVDCSAPVQQNSQINAGGDAGNVCSGVMARCTSSVSSDWDSYTWDVQVIAPRGQGWLVGPSSCSGIGTDNLRCSFSWDYSLTSFVP